MFDQPKDLQKSKTIKTKVEIKAEEAKEEKKEVKAERIEIKPQNKEDPDVYVRSGTDRKTLFKKKT